MFPRQVSVGGAPADPQLHCGAAGVDHAQVSEGEDAVPRRGGAGGEGEALGLTGGGRGEVTVAPPVGDHRPVRPGGCGTPGPGGVGIAALGVLHPLVGEGEDAGGVGGGGAGVGNPLTGAQPHSSTNRQAEGEDLQGRRWLHLRL